MSVFLCTEPVQTVYSGRARARTLDLAGIFVGLTLNRVYAHDLNRHCRVHLASFCVRVPKHERFIQHGSKMSQPAVVLTINIAYYEMTCFRTKVLL